jgi:hypothetical protein
MAGENLMKWVVAAVVFLLAIGSCVTAACLGESYLLHQTGGMFWYGVSLIVDGVALQVLLRAAIDKDWM